MGVAGNPTRPLMRAPSLPAALAAALAAAVPFPATAEIAPEPPPAALDVYLCIGQSNMAGRAKPGPDDTGRLPGVWLLDAKGAWAPAAHPYNGFSSVRKNLAIQGISPAFGFARRRRGLHPDRAIGLVVNARGWTSLAEWAEGGHCFAEAVRRTREAVAGGGTLRGILWIQGETDLATDKADSYLEGIAALIRDLRAELGGAPFVAGEIHGANALNNALARLPARVPMTAVAPAGSLTKFDTWHFDGASAITLGERMADALAEWAPAD